MKKYLSSILVLLAMNAHATTQQCPPAFAYRHLGVGANWEISNEYSILGWSVSQTPAAQNFGGSTTVSNPLYVVLNNANDTKTFYMTCRIELMAGLSVDAVQSIAQVEPRTNPNFKKIDSHTYICKTTIDHPEVCISNSFAAPVVNDATGGSIN